MPEGARPWGLTGWRERVAWGRLRHADHGGLDHLARTLDWPDATLVSGNAVDIVARLKQESTVPLRSHGSLSLNRALMAIGLVDRVQLTIFPVISGQTGTDPAFQGAADFDLELLEVFAELGSDCLARRAG